MDVRITKLPDSGINNEPGTRISGTIRAITSKSAAHRLLICAALADSETFLTYSQSSQDIDATIRCLQALGAGITFKEDGLLITPINRSGLNKEEIYLLNCGESGATLRFILPVCGALGLSVSITMSGRLPSRPLTELYDEMTSHGCKLSKPGLSPLKCEGQLINGTYTLPGNITSQYVSGLLFALPLLRSNGDKGESRLHVTGVLESRPYVDMTLDALRLFGVTVLEEGQSFRIPGGQTICSQKNVYVEGDWSNAAFWLCAGALGKNAVNNADGNSVGANSAGAVSRNAVSQVTCTGLNLNSRQGDKAIVELLSRYGANVVCKDDAVTVSPAALRGINIDAGDIPDLVPVLAAVAAAAEGKTVIRNAARLRMKESDRLHTVAASLSALGADITETEDGLVIIGKKTLTGGETQSYGDHRIAMTAAVLSTVCTGPVIIRDAEAVRKSYPDFFEDFKTALGGELL